MWHIDVVCSQRVTYIHCKRWLEHLMYDLCSGRLRTETTIQLQSKKGEEANKGTSPDLNIHSTVCDIYSEFFILLR